MRIVWIVASLGEARIASVAAERLQEDGIAVEFASEFSDTLSLLRDRCWPVVSILAEVQPRAAFDGEAIERLDRRFPDPGIRLLAFAEARARRNRDIESFHASAAQQLDLWSRRFADAMPDAVVCWQSASLANRAPISVARAFGIRTLIFVNGPTFSRSAIGDIDESENWSELINLIEAQPGFKLDANARKLALDHVDEVLKVHAQFRPRETPILPRGVFKPIVTSWTRKAANASGPDERRFPAVLEWKLYWERIIWSLKDRAGLLPYSNLQLAERYVYFPMQNLADVKLTGRNPVYADQVALAEQIALSMRPGLKLYVREHPNHPGMYDVARLKRLARDPMVRLIHPHESNIDLIRHATAVVCVNSTAGWEAYLSQVPVVVLGNPFFRRSRLVFGVDNLNDLSRLIRRAVDEGRRLYAERQNEWLWFIWAALVTCSPGYPFGYKVIFGAVPKQDPVVNGRLIGEALLARLLPWSRHPDLAPGGLVRGAEGWPVEG